eukprot:6194121-Pleurochrysis_carterae.AAC.3
MGDVDSVIGSSSRERSPRALARVQEKKPHKRARAFESTTAYPVHERSNRWRLWAYTPPVEVVVTLKVAQRVRLEHLNHHLQARSSLSINAAWHARLFDPKHASQQPITCSTDRREAADAIAWACTSGKKAYGRFDAGTRKRPRRSSTRRRPATRPSSHLA